MARAATTSDVFNAVGEPRRREILDLLADGERPVNDVVDRLGLDQPSVSKHLRVLRDVGLVSSRRDGRQMLYRVNGRRIKAVYDWASRYERFWDRQLDAIKERAERTARGATGKEQERRS